MSFVGRVGSVIKRAVLYLPRRIATGYHSAAMGVKPIAKGMIAIEDEKRGPFVSTVVRFNLASLGRESFLRI
jgi:hypothetical protein